MPTEKMVPVSFGVTPEFKDPLKLEAAHEQRSRTHLLEKLLVDHSGKIGIVQTSSDGKSTTKRAA